MTATTARAVCRSGLWTFRTQEAATDARAAVRAKGQIYACTLCAGWHWKKRR